MILPRGYIRTLISWLRPIIRTTAFRSYTSILSFLLQVFRRCQAIINGKERVFREPGLALSSQPAPINQKKSTSVTLAVPLFEPPPRQSDGWNGVASNIQSPLDSCAPCIISMPEPSTTSSIVTPSHPVAPIQSLDSITLTPTTPGQIKRYDRIEFQGDYAVYEVPKGPLDCSGELDLVSGWEPLTHPEGALFFYHSYKRVFTDADIRASGMVDNIGKAVEKAYKEIENAGFDFHPSVELVLELMEGDREEWGYYFADHDSRVIFWFEAHKSGDLIGNVRGVKCSDHIRYALESQYWLHVELYPNKRSLPKDVVVRLREIVMYTQADNITSDTSLAPFSSEEVASMLSLMDPLMNSAGIEHEYAHEHSVWIVGEPEHRMSVDYLIFLRLSARFMGEFCELWLVGSASRLLNTFIGNVKFVNFCGQPGARLNADQSLYGDPNTRSNALLRVMNFILFGSPNAYNKAVQKIWVDSTIVQPRWKNFINRLNSEWNGYTIFSTVMLAVDISFLAVPPVQTQNAAILVSYMSTLCAMGSLVVSLVLAGQVNDSRRDSAKSVVSSLFDCLAYILYIQASFMGRMSSSVLGLESLALMLSLPYALLIWGMVFFAAALSIVIFHTSGVVTISIISPIWVAILILATWPVLASNDVHVSGLFPWITKQIKSHPMPSWTATRSRVESDV
ncbi:uncharacterized protein BJ212DRAFT_1577075 [Suillus subaureus]|uniref:Uncharacterized protein n=1 Tax=Suillus subaureus TaxID=48587 RepID=A0A9P7JDA0_9AGAM|nr:uncharacterized protein BJ212DRAFT_1577075 [Suillus subaureus]KAG1816398.1 hypothetical protein BJ212DRAFT_1577075 [Suillus subaureus]